MSPLPLGKPVVRVLALASVFLLGSGASAQGRPDGQGPSAPSWGLGLAAMYSGKPYRDFDHETKLWPMVSYESRWIRILGPGVDLKLGGTESLAYALTLRYADDGYDSGDSPYLEGMSDRKASVWLGARVDWRGEWVRVSAAWRGDASSHSKGQTLRLGVERRIQWGPVGVTPRVGLEWQDASFVNYYYGVTAAEARSNRPAYDAGSTANSEVGVRLDYRIAPNQLMFLDVGRTALGSAIRSSPLVDQRSVTDARVGYVYRF